jgi:hypothetical protein
MHFVHVWAEFHVPFQSLNPHNHFIYWARGVFFRVQVFTAVRTWWNLKLVSRKVSKVYQKMALNFRPKKEAVVHIANPPLAVHDDLAPSLMGPVPKQHAGRLHVTLETAIIVIMVFGVGALCSCCYHWGWRLQHNQAQGSSPTESTLSNYVLDDPSGMPPLFSLKTFLPACMSIHPQVMSMPLCTIFKVTLTYTCNQRYNSVRQLFQFGL